MDFEKHYREESGRILATLIRLLGDFDLAEEMLQEAYTVALQTWPAQGIPANPPAWLVSTARHKAIDRLRREQRFAVKQVEIAKTAEVSVSPLSEFEEDMFQDDPLRLIFTCCHPALALESQVALTLRTVCGITTEEISSAFLIPPATMAQRLVRAKRKIRDAGIPYRIPAQESLASRLDAVLLVVYLIFNEGYLASKGSALIRSDLCAEAIRLARVLCQLLPQYAETQGLLGLLLLQDSRRDARTSTAGDLILLEEQDRRLWHEDQIEEGSQLTRQALRRGYTGGYALQAAIAAVHAHAKTAEETDWRQIVGLYDLLLRHQPSPIIEVNRAIAIAMAGPLETGLALLDDLERREELSEFHLLPAARADLLRRLRRIGEAEVAYRRALSLCSNEIECRFLRRRLTELGAAGVL